MQTRRCSCLYKVHECRTGWRPKSGCPSSSPLSVALAPAPASALATADAAAHVLMTGRSRYPLAASILLIRRVLSLTVSFRGLRAVLRPVEGRFRSILLCSAGSSASPARRSQQPMRRFKSPMYIFHILLALPCSVPISMFSSFGRIVGLAVVEPKAFAHSAPSHSAQAVRSSAWTAPEFAVQDQEDRR